MSTMIFFIQTQRNFFNHRKIQYSINNSQREYKYNFCLAFS